MEESRPTLSQITPAMAFRLVLAQLAVTIFFTIAAWLLVDGSDARTAAISALAGGMIATLANAWFSLKVFRQDSSEEPAKVLRSLYLGEMNKLLITASLFVIAFVLIKPVNGAILIAVYFVAHMTPFLASMLVKNTH